MFVSKVLCIYRKIISQSKTYRIVSGKAALKFPNSYNSYNQKYTKVCIKDDNDRVYAVCHHSPNIHGDKISELYNQRLNSHVF
jgi:hypothetical protein